MDGKGATNRGQFIVIEGLDGSGKSTQVDLLLLKMKTESIPFYYIGWPNDEAPIGKFIRENFLSGKEEMSEETATILFAADRMYSVNGIIETLSQGINVIGVRYYLSSLAYNGKEDVVFPYNCNRPIMERLRPDMTIYIDVCAATCLERINKRNTTNELYEKLDSLLDTRKRYFEGIDRLRKDGELIYVVDGTLEPEKLFDDIWSKVDTILTR